VIRPDLDGLPPAFGAEVEAAGLRACWASPVIVPDDETLLACVIVWRDVEGPGGQGPLPARPVDHSPVARWSCRRARDGN